VALAALYVAAKVVELSGSGVPDFSEEPFPDWDRGSVIVLVRSAMRWLGAQCHHVSSQVANGTIRQPIQVQDLC
jgi:hypothetical protein